MTNRRTVQILGSTWTIVEGTVEEFPALEEADGYTDSSARLVVLDDLASAKNDKFCKSNLVEHKNRVLRHEIVHAFLEESGLNTNSNPTTAWAANEEMVEWFAIQLPKIVAVCEELNIMKSMNFLPFDEVED